MKKLLVLASVCLMLLAPMFAGTNTKDDYVWITIGQDAVKQLALEFDDRNWQFKGSSHKANKKIHILKVKESQLNTISRFMHEEFGRCGGYIIHNSYEDAVDAGTRELNPPIRKMALTYNLDRATEVGTLIGALSETNIYNTIDHLSSYPTRYYTSQSSVDSANWLKAQWETMASGRSDVTVELYSHSGYPMPSVIMTITGAHQPQDMIVIGGHLDSTSFPTSDAPGADDDASGIATLTEIARAALSNGFTPARTVKFMAYAAEEVGLRGSGDLAADAAANGDNVIGVLQLDMTNYQGSSDDIWLMTDYTNAPQNDFIKNLIDTYTTSTWNTSSCGYGCSDHASWHNQGFAASMPFEAQMNSHNPNIHTVNDTLGADASHALKFAEMGAAYLMELAKGGLNGNAGTDPGPVGSTGPTSTELTNNTTLSNLNGSAGAEDRYYIDVPAGATNLVIATSGGSGDVDLYTRFGSAPTTGAYDCRPYASGNNENCTEANPAAGTHHIMLRGYSTYSGVTLSVSYTDPGGPTNQAPTAGFTSSTNNLAVSFTDTSSDSDGTIASWSWNFGDGNSSTNQNPSHTYAADGTYSVTLTVTDNDGATDSVSNNVSVTGGGSGGWTTLADDNFETGWDNWTDGGSDVARRADANNAHQGTYSIRIRDNSGAASAMSKGVNLNGYSTMEVSFWYGAVSMENGEDFFVEFYNGSAWQVIGNYVSGTDFSNNTFSNPTITINSSSYNFNSNNQIRIRCDASGNNDQIFIDEVLIRAQ